MEEPNRCPFCGMMSVGVKHEPCAIGAGPDTVPWFVECGYCDARGPRVKGDRAAERAIMLWNAAPKEGVRP